MALEFEARGFTKVLGDVEIGAGTVRGSLAVGGKLSARELDLSGNVRVDGEFRISGSLRSQGTLRVGAGLSAQRARLNGTVEVGGSLVAAETLQWRGSLEAGQDVRAATVLFNGHLSVHGQLRARSISGEVESLSSVGSIAADRVEIRRRKPFLPFPIFVLPPPPWHELEVQRIEATEVRLSGVRVHRLKADRIWLGPDTHVEYVEGTIVDRHKDAHVGPESESPPPSGLTR
jgi:cytoskeletal protein CcmA (bactofilin family)